MMIQVAIILDNSKMCERGSTLVEQVTASTESVRREVQQVKEASQSMAKLLQDMVQQFTT